MILDEAHIIVEGGKGGDGHISFRREKYIPRGGPDGGNGGKGGDVYFTGTTDLSALYYFRYKHTIIGDDGRPGEKNKKTGKNGKDISVKIPIGTVITDKTSGEHWEVLKEDDEILIAHGGKGGRGNFEFRSNENKAPTFAEKGEEGELRDLHLDLKFIADVGIIGLPSVGKSSLLNRLTKAHAKVGDYPFTTLEANLGEHKGIILADIPGLIEGAHKGRGLGIKFLKHINKTKLLLHCIDCTTSDLKSDYQKIRNELGEYDKDFIKKDEILALTKTDLIEKKDLTKKINHAKKFHKKIISCSIIDDESMHALQKYLMNLLKRIE